MIETKDVHRARPKCSRCGWVGDWREGRLPDAAEGKARAQLEEHVSFWHASE